MQPKLNRETIISFSDHEKVDLIFQREKEFLQVFISFFSLSSFKGVVSSNLFSHFLYFLSSFSSIFLSYLSLQELAKQAVE